MASERAETTAVGPAPVAEEARGVRVAVPPYVFRGMLVGMAAVAVALHRATGNRDLAWRFAKARARTLTWMLGVDVRVCGLERLAGGGPFVFAPNHQSHLDILVLLGDRKSTRLNSSHSQISYAVFCLKKKKKKKQNIHAHEEMSTTE